MHILSFMFQTYCMSFHRLELWFNKICSLRLFNKVSVVFHRAFKRICNMNSWESNHDACDSLENPIFKHLPTRRSFNRYRRWDSSENVPHIRYYFYSSNLADSVRDVFHDFYEIDIGKCDADSVFGRIKFFQRTEERSHIFIFHSLYFWNLFKFLCKLLFMK